VIFNTNWRMSSAVRGRPGLRRGSPVFGVRRSGGAEFNEVVLLAGRYQLRHTAASEVWKEHGLEAAQVVLGHEKANVTEVYAQRNLSLAAKVSSSMG
jgi:hypothetical protein